MSNFFLRWERVFLTCFITIIMHAVLHSFASGAPLNPDPPAQPVRLIFIHHSTGENWLSDENGRLGLALMNNNYFVSDTNYGWGPESIGDYTDIGHWWLWFRSPNSNTFTNALYIESEQHCSYSRLSQAPPGENEIIMFKSCFPNSAMQGNPYDPVPPINSNPLRGQDSGSEYHTVANAKGIYVDLLEYFRTRQDKLFIAIAAPPLSDPTYADNARAFNNWLVYEWLYGYPYNNVAVFDFYNVLTTNGGSPDINDYNQETGNHHRWRNSAIQHKTDGDNDGNPNVLEYPSDPYNDHPSQAGNLKATGEYLPLLNIFYNCWTGAGGCPEKVKTHFEENDPAITYTGTWNTYTCAFCSGGDLKYSNQTGAKATFSFSGTGIKWIIAKGPILGKAKICLDSACTSNPVDLFSSSPQWQVVLQKTGLTAGNHTLSIEVSGQKNPGSSNYFIDLDALEVVP